MHIFVNDAISSALLRIIFHCSCLRLAKTGFLDAGAGIGQRGLFSLGHFGVSLPGLSMFPSFWLAGLHPFHEEVLYQLLPWPLCLGAL